MIDMIVVYYPTNHVDMKSQMSTRLVNIRERRILNLDTFLKSQGIFTQAFRQTAKESVVYEYSSKYR